MKTKIADQDLIVIVVATAALSFISGCAETQANNSKSLLTAAGFRTRTPKTAEQQKLYASLPNNKLEHATVKGKTFCIYKDEKAGVAYVGGEREHQKFLQLCAQQHVSTQPEEEMNSATAARSYKYWGVGASLF